MGVGGMCVCGRGVCVVGVCVGVGGGGGGGVVLECLFVQSECFPHTLNTIVLT